jgi:hypothetical protein
MFTAPSRRALPLALALAVCAGSLPAADPVVGTVRREVQPLIDKYAGGYQKKVLDELALGNRFPAHLKTPVRVKSITDPWGALADLEKSGLDLAGLAKGGLAKLPAILDGLSASIGRPTGVARPVPKPKLVTLDDHGRYVAAILDRARELHDAAWFRIRPKDRAFSFKWAAELLANFGPQMDFSQVNDKTLPGLQNDRAFCTLAHTQIDWSRILGAFHVLCQLSDPAYLKELKSVLERAKPIDKQVPGVTGDLLYHQETRHGLILFGGKGVNTYELKVPVALLIDLGGDDTYKGKIASNFDAEHPLSVVIDLDGNDTYEPEEYGLATGRLGIGLLIDLAGKDTYKLLTGSGGVGLGGIGVLCDVAGDDTYTGSKFTQGVAIGGLGLLIDFAGEDKYTSQGYALGLGGPAGVGAVIDVAGNDVYQCGKHFPSGYNVSDAPQAKPGDANFQYDAFGMGMGLGRRILTKEAKQMAYNLAGGIGLLIDIDGNDRYESSNFSQGCGYFFGAGVVLDLAGNDIHAAARYGHASGAHFGMGLFIDYAGNDTYRSTGPTYNCGCAWDRSVFLFIDAQGDDIYELERSNGLGVADIGSWAVFADLAGRDRYQVNGGMGRTSKDSLAVFFDGGGEDDYSRAKADVKPANGRTHYGGNGALFVDRN